MTSLQIATTVCASVLAILACVGTYRAFRSTAGPIIWVYTWIISLYVFVMLSWRSNKPCNWPADGSAIIVGNHTSPVDPILIWHRHNDAWPKHKQRVVGFMVAREYVTPRNLVGWICRTVQSIPVNRSGQDTEAVRAALRRLKKGELLGLFPEGRINPNPEEGLMPFNTGIAFLALKSGAPVYPVWIHGSPRSESMVACFLKFSTVRITFGEPIDLRQLFGDEKKPTLETLEKATQHVRSAVEKLSEDRWFE